MQQSLNGSFATSQDATQYFLANISQFLYPISSQLALVKLSAWKLEEQHTIHRDCYSERTSANCLLLTISVYRLYPVLINTWQVFIHIVEIADFVFNRCTNCTYCKTVVFQPLCTMYFLVNQPPRTVGIIDVHTSTFVSFPCYLLTDYSYRW